MARRKKEKAPAPLKWEDVPEIPTEEQPYPLPEGWKWVRLEEVAGIIMGQSPAGTETTDDSSYTPLIGGASDMGALYPCSKKYTKKPTKLSRNNDIILCIRATLGKPVFSDGIYCLGRGVAAIRPLSIERKFLRYFFLNFESYFYEHAVGSTFLQISSDKLKEMPVPYPRLEIQQRVVASIESLFSQLDEAAEKVQAVIDNHEARKQAILHQAFSGELTRNMEIKDEEPLKDIPEIPKEEQPYPLPKGWKWTYLGDAVELLRGVTYSKKDAHKEKKPGHCLILRGGNIKEGYIDFNDDDNVYVDKSLVKKAQLIREYDVLIVSSTGSIKVIGRAGISNVMCKDVAFGAFLTLARPNDKYNKRYVNYFFQSGMYRNRIKALVNGVNINNIKKDYISGTPFAFPPLKTQEHIVNILTPVVSHLDSVTRVAGNILDEIAQLKQSILNKAFGGELA